MRNQKRAGLFEKGNKKILMLLVKNVSALNKTVMKLGNW